MFFAKLYSIFQMGLYPMKKMNTKIEKYFTNNCKVFFVYKKYPYIKDLKKLYKKMLEFH